MTALTDLCEDDRLFQHNVTAFAEREIRPHVREMDFHAAIPAALIEKLFALGVMGLQVPDTFGGTGATLFQSVLAVEALSKVDPSVGVFVDVQNTLVASAIARWGNDDVKAACLPGLARQDVGAYALSEAESGSDAFALQTRAVRAGDAFVLNGRKLWITNAAEARVFIVFATVDPAAGHHGVTAFIIDRSTPGLGVGRKEDKLGIRASSTCELLLDNCRVPAGRVLGEIGKGYQVAIETLNEGRIGIGAQMVGLAAGALDHAIGYVTTRRQFGQPIAEFQAVRFDLARAATDVEAARLLVYNAARLRDHGRPFVKEAAMAKLLASEVAERVASLAVNLFGGVGFVKDYPVEKLYRDAKIGQIYEGTTNLQLHTIAKHII